MLNIQTSTIKIITSTRDFKNSGNERGADGGNTKGFPVSFFIYRFIDDFLISVDKVVYVQNNAGISLLILLLLLLYYY